MKTPQPGQPGGATYSSDTVAAVIRALGAPYVALNPGASFRGLHDSLVKYPGNRGVLNGGALRHPLLAVVANNQSFFNDEVHQERVAHTCGRNPANKWIGQRIGGPDIDIAAMARAQGCAGWGPVHDAAGLRAALTQALEAVRAGQPALVDVRVAQGYGTEMTAALTRDS